MRSIHRESWFIIVGLLGASLLHAQNPLEELEAKLQKQAESSGKPGAGAPSEFVEGLPIPKTSSSKDGRKSVELNGFGPQTKQATDKAGGVVKPAEVVAQDPPYLGMTLERSAIGEAGLRVIDVTDQSPAFKAGFHSGDRVLAIAGTAVNDIDGFAGEIAKFSANQPVTFLVDRRGRQVELVAVLLPRSLAMQIIGGIDPNAPIGNRQSLPSTTGESIPRVPQRVDSQSSIGIVLAPLSDAFRRTFGIPVFRGASVLEVMKNSPGQAAGLAPGDCIVELDGRTILSDEDVVQWKRAAAPGSLASIGFFRGAAKMQTTLQVPFDGQANSSEGLPTITAEMLTAEFVSNLQAELAATRAELARVQSELDRIKVTGSR
jgi:membrane-associated protease RseP (regulator of RpoE activity)